MNNPLPLNTLGIDFGTSNSAAGILVNGKPFVIEIEAGNKTLPTSVFFDFANQKTLFGSAANAALIQGRDGRFMRSLKSVLGTSLMREKRQFMGQSLTFIDIISRFLGEVKSRAEGFCRLEFDYALSGRPVHFHTGNATKDRQALIDLTECYLQAGFRDVQFLYEPEAAAIAHGTLAGDGALGLIVDIGGGTSDFSLFRSHPSPGNTRPEIAIIANHGVRIGGTNFDRSISVDHVMPLIGHRSKIRKEMGAGTYTVPNALFQDLATWQKIPFLYTAETRRDVAYLKKLAVDQNRFSRLETILELELGHDVAFAVESGKILANGAHQDGAQIDLAVIEPHLSAPLNQADLAKSLAQDVEKIKTCAAETLAMAGCLPEQVGTVIFVGGSSQMAAVEQAMIAVFPKAALAYSEAFTAVVDGLAIASGRSFGGNA